MLYSKIEGSGKPFVIMHGFLGMSDNWKTLGTQFAESGFEVHMLDLRNHGRSIQSAAFNYDLMVNDVVEYCREKNLTSIYLLGHSMGGKVAMFTATQFPDLVEKLIVADIGVKYYKPHHDEILAGLSAVDFSKKPSRSDVEEILTPYIPDFGTRQFLMKSLYWKEPGQLAFRFNLDAFIANKDVIGDALNADAVFNKPTLFLKGANSRYILETDAAEIKKHFPKAAIESIANAGHWLHAENPKDFYDLTMQFLNA
ncbi:alpha/beta fold hydrolase [Flavobacterium antarcticum]|uniref:alpha/beta fold hydrolase n=1 Tax=Flavobacterium antarcticum TaxID=271155 RepID=UPI0003B2FBFE|nr:alpha/beta fold hydrolase [Flavobacterium antarcticum]